MIRAKTGHPGTETMREAPAELLEFLAALPPQITPLHLAVRTRVLTRAPGANELVYDAYNAVSCAYTFSERLKEAFCHVAAYAGHVNLGLNRGAELDDPLGLLQGSGASIRHVTIRSVDDLDRPGLDALLEAAVAQGLSAVDAPPDAPRSIVKRSKGAKRRP